MSYYFINGPLAGPPAFPSAADQRIAQYFDLIKNHLDYQHGKWMQGELFATIDPQKFYTRTNDFQYLLLYLLLIYLEKDALDQVSGCWSDAEPWRTKYKFDCVLKYFRCLGFDAERAFAIFDLSKGCSGIGCMIIEHQDQCGHPPFKIQ